MSTERRAYSVNALADELGIDRRTVAKRLVGVEPASKERGAPRYLMCDVVRALIDHEVSQIQTKLAPDPGASSGDGDDPLGIEREKLRLTKAQADKIEIENAQTRAQLIAAERVETIWGAIAGAIRAKVLALPSRAAPLVAGERDVRAIEHKLDDLAREALSDLADSQVDAYGSDLAS